MRENEVYLYQDLESFYPDKSDCFNPSEAYPEYPFAGEVSTYSNKVYEMIRNSLYHMGFDKENFGKKEWNPLKEMIHPGEVVLIKANMVMHVNEKPGNGTECLITHPSLIRAMLDYVILALGGKGKIIVGDAPMQSCDFERLVEEQGYLDLIDFYKNKGVMVELADFRNYKTAYKNGILQRLENEKENDAIIVDLGSKSEFCSLEQDRYQNLRITNYDHSIMKEHHNSRKNEYSIAKSILEADVIINMPKPKTHRKAGVTIALKNLVGINTNKEWLPHHTAGSKTEGGDEYDKKSIIKRFRTHFLEKADVSIVKGRKLQTRLNYQLAFAFAVLGRLFLKERYKEGSWYGNDTIWRTILDLNKIVFFADKEGCMKETKQRRMLIVADMIISGEGEGPLLPDPKKVGIIAMGQNPICFDEAIAAVMGFKPSLIPSISNAQGMKWYDFSEKEKTLLTSNLINYHRIRPGDLAYEDTLKFTPSEGWRNHFTHQVSLNQGTIQEIVSQA